MNGIWRCFISSIASYRHSSWPTQVEIFAQSYLCHTLSRTHIIKVCSSICRWREENDGKTEWVTPSQHSHLLHRLNIDSAIGRLRTEEHRTECYDFIQSSRKSISREVAVCLKYDYSLLKIEMPMKIYFLEKWEKKKKENINMILSQQDASSLINRL